MNSPEFPRPPRPAARIIRRIERRRTNHSIHDDLLEAFTRIRERRGYAAACLWYWSQSLVLAIYESVTGAKWRFLIMQNYLKPAFRNAVRQKRYSLINVIGLAVGIACGILIFVYVNYELSYDAYHPDAGRIYRAATHLKMYNSDFISADAPAPLSAALKREYPEAEYACQVISSNQILLDVDGKYFREDGLLFVDKDFFDIWSIEFRAGGSLELLNRPSTLLLTETLAHKYFGSSDPVGKIIQINRRPFEIAGIIKACPPNSHLRYQFLTSISNYEESSENMAEWANLIGQVFVKLRPSVSGEDFAEKTRSIAHQHRGDYFRQRSWTYELLWEPIRSLHLHSRADAGNNMVVIYGLSVIGVLILFVACFNFVNLATATAVTRAKEVALRKVVGAERTHLIQQFLAETAFFAASALLLAVLLVILVLPVFNRLVERQFRVNALLQSNVLFYVLFLILMITVLAGGYPSLVLSRIKPAAALANRFGSGGYRSILRRVFITVQFVIVTVLIVSTLTIFHQIGYMKNRNLGFENKQKLIIPVRLTNNADFVKSEFLKNPDISGASASFQILGRIFIAVTSRSIGEDPKEFVIAYEYADPDFIPEYKIPIVAGRNFDKNLGSDVGRALILNESAVKIFGWDSPQKALGKVIESHGFGASFYRTVIGVTRDFHFQGLQRPIGPLGILYVPARFRFLNLTVRADHIHETLAFIQSKWSELHLGEIFSYSFLDERFNQLYAADQRTGQIFAAFAFLAVFLSCLGLYGLSAFVTMQRTKEIGIRKVLGATVPKILGLVSREFVGLVALANILAWPWAYWMMSRWLKNYAYRITLDGTVFALTFGIGLLIALIAVGYHALKSATSNPVDSLKYYG